VARSDARDCPKCGVSQAIDNEACRHCGVIFAKFEASGDGDAAREPPRRGSSGLGDALDSIKDFLKR